jgi:hypothetical protein
MRNPLRGRIARAATASIATTLLAGLAPTTHAAVGAKLILQGCFVSAPL